ncbi:MAG TPA: hypothetical protein VGJ70_19390 [Solirubrobacteraceae bacterium]
MRRAVVAGALAQRPGRGGHAWALLQYVLGLRELGWDVLFVDRLDTTMCGGAAIADSAELRWLESVMRGFGLEGAWSVLHDGGAFGVPRERLVGFARRADVLLNVMGYLDDDDVLDAVALRVFVDIDPGFPQMWCALGLVDPFAGHDAFVTVGENVGDPSCAVPTCGLEWITTPQPVTLGEWDAFPVDGGSLSSVVSWRGPYGPVTYGGVTYGLRAHQFRRFADLPRRTGHAIELALDIDAADEPDRAALEAAGWRLADPRAVAGDPWRYRDYVRRAQAELMVAKDMYVRSRCGWFSDRSICYLASGRAVIAQDTGLEDLGEGVLAFGDVDEAAEAVARVAADPRRHGAAARALAEERFAAARVLPRLFDRLGVSACVA